MVVGQAIGLGFAATLRYLSGMTDTEQALLDTLLELETAVASVNAEPKPDLIGPGNEEEALSVLNNVRKPLKLGYIMVKNR